MSELFSCCLFFFIFSELIYFCYIFLRFFCCLHFPLVNMFFFVFLFLNSFLILFPSLFFYFLFGLIKYLCKFLLLFLILFFRLLSFFFLVILFLPLFSLFVFTVKHHKKQEMLLKTQEIANRRSGKLEFLKFFRNKQKKIHSFLDVQKNQKMKLKKMMKEQFFIF